MSTVNLQFECACSKDIVKIVRYYLINIARALKHLMMKFDCKVNDGASLIEVTPNVVTR